MMQVTHVTFCSAEFTNQKETRHPVNMNLAGLQDCGMFFKKS
jgi:hypothetical protein